MHVCLCAFVDSGVFVVALTDARALCKQQPDVFEGRVKLAFFAPFLSIIHHCRRWLLVIKALLLQGSI